MLLLSGHPAILFGRNGSNNQVSLPVDEAFVASVVDVPSRPSSDGSFTC